MKQRKEFEKPTAEPVKKPESKKTIQELTEQINHIIGKDPKKAARAVENWVSDTRKPQKKAS
jgi:hypothetical protein